ncbi:MAG TPA: methionyl-tRNA formyltransferase [Thermodesulfobacteriota bacterium]|nr:methionyl-tRNA formyltransferase [Thermodesulfobacteriota bacterium]
MKNTFRIIFMGTSAFAVSSLKALIEKGEEVVCVVTQPDRPKGRGREVQQSPVKKVALARHLLLLQPQSVKDAESIAYLRNFSPDLFVVVAFGQILSREVLQIPPHGAINVHASLLPKYRGAAPINWALINGEEMTGVTAMLLDEGMDTGPILLQRPLDIEPEDTASSLHDKLSHLGAELLTETIDRLRRGELKPVPQDHAKASYAPRLKKDDGLIDWRKSARDINNLIRGLTPWPTAYTHLEGKALKIFNSVVIEEEVKGEAGKISGVSREGIRVITGKGSLLIRDVQLQDRKRMKVPEFIQGYRVQTGTVLP